MIRVIAAAAAVHSLRCPPPIARLTPLKATTLDKLDASTAVDDDDVWNGAYREADWEATYNSLPADALAEPTIVPVEGVVPASLRGGVLYRCSPANFDRGGTRYKHVLDGDGFMLRVAFGQDGTKATVTGRYVETTPYVEETTADEILYRNTFGTQPTGGPLRNAFTVTLKNVANTNVVSWGGRLLALWEAGAPHELDAVTLETMGEATDLCRGPPAGKKCTRGVTIDGGIIDETLGFGEAFTAHPHVDGDKLVAFTWAQQPQREEMGLTFREINGDWTDAIPPVSHAMPDCALAPHDCGLTENYHVVVENRASIQMAPFVFGLKGPAQVLDIATKEGARCHLIPRAGSGVTEPVVIEVYPVYRTDGATLADDVKCFAFRGRTALVQHVSHRFDAASGRPRSARKRDTFHDPRSGRRLPVAVDGQPAGAGLAPARVRQAREVCDGLARGLDFARVDLFDAGASFFLGEVTVYPKRGEHAFEPRAVDGELGRAWCRQGNATR